MRRPNTRALILTALTLLTVAFSVVGSTRPAQALDRDTKNKVLRASVKLLTPYDADPDLGSLCSGTMLNQEGYILTNFHCVGYVTDGTEIPKLDDLGLQPGDLYNKNGLSVIAVTEDPRQLPKPTYIAQVMTGDSNLDFAVMKVVAYANSKQKLKMPLAVVAMDMGDSDRVETLDEIFVIGYPGIGGDTVTATEGKISGFLDEDGDGTFDWFKTDVLVNQGNSGGSALNEKGELIGIPTQRRSDQSGNVIYLVRPTNFTVPYIEKAQQVAAGKGTIDPGNNANNKQDPGTKPKGSASFGEITFGTGFDDDEGVTGVATDFESGVPEVHAGLPYKNMPKNTPWGYTWTYEGRDVTGDEDLRWEFGTSGLLDLYLQGRDGLSEGTYGLRVSLRGDTVQEAEFTVAGPNSPPQPEPPTPTESSGVLVSGSVIDSSTRRPVNGAVVVFLKPGMTIADFDRDNTDNKTKTLYAFGATGADGTFTAIPPLQRGETYSAIVGAKGYRRLAVDDALEIREDDPDLLELDPVELDRQ